MSETEDVILPLDKSILFRNKALKFEKMLQDINDATMELQVRLITLADCRLVLESLLESVEANHNVPGSTMSNCKLDSWYIGPTAHIVKDPYFESGVTKIQRGNKSDMTAEEKDACKNLLLSSRGDYVMDTNNGHDIDQLSFKERYDSKRRRVNSSVDKYIDCSFILGSVAEAERLWSIADKFRPDHRKNTTPIVFEALLFLNINEEYWNIHTVKDAMRDNTSRIVESRIEEDEELEEEINSR